MSNYYKPKVLKKEIQPFLEKAKEDYNEFQKIEVEFQDFIKESILIVKEEELKSLAELVSKMYITKKKDVWKTKVVRGWLFKREVEYKETVLEEHLDINFKVLTEKFPHLTFSEGDNKLVVDFVKVKNLQDIIDKFNKEGICSVSYCSLLPWGLPVTAHWGFNTHLKIKYAFYNDQDTGKSLYYNYIYSPFKDYSLYNETDYLYLEDLINQIGDEAELVEISAEDVLELKRIGVQI